MKFLPVLLVLSLFAAIQGTREGIRYQTRKRDSILQAVDVVGAMKAGGTGTVGTMTQGMRAFGNVLDSISMLKPEEQKPPIGSASSVKPNAIADFGAPANLGAASTSGNGPETAGGSGTGASQAGSNALPPAGSFGAKSSTGSSSSGSDGSRGNRNEKRTTDTHSSLIMSIKRV